MDNEIRLSVIIPIYNVEKYIGRCARSLMEQTLRDGVEFIFINDATPDGSIRALDEIISAYSMRKGQIRLINNSRNLGITATRKRGIEAARGKYIGWCDPDDWCELDMFETMLENTNDGKADIVVCNSFGHTMVNGIDCVTENVFIQASSPQDVIKNLWRQGKQYHSFTPSLCFQISRRSLIKQAAENIYPTNRSEDRFMMLNCFYFASSAVWVGKPLYHYDCRIGGSLTHQKLTREGWIAQMKNIGMLENLLNADIQAREYITTINSIKFDRKMFFATTFDNCWEYWRTYKECYKDICKITNTPFRKRWKVYIIYNFYPLFWLKNHKSFNLS